MIDASVGSPVAPDTAAAASNKQEQRVAQLPTEHRPAARAVAAQRVRSVLREPATRLVGAETIETRAECAEDVVARPARGVIQREGCERRGYWGCHAARISSVVVIVATSASVLSMTASA